MWKTTLIFIARGCASGIVAYSIPRFLIASGVPLDDWIKHLATTVKNAPAWLTYDFVYWFLTVIFGFFVISLTYLVPYRISRKKKLSEKKQ